MVSVTINNKIPYVTLFHDGKKYYVHIFDGEESVDIPLSGDPKEVINRISVYVGDYY